ncbi:MAG: DegV family protein [Acholeplasma sp.]|jgi:DegV family protein with EDD domain|nr:DegV family protein [Acholeplasma sp.]
MKVAVITDSGANLQKPYLEAHKNLFVVPLNIVIDGKNFKDQIEVSAKEVYEKLDTHQISTSLPDVKDLEDIIEDVKKQGYEAILVINISSGLSGTFNAFRLVLNQVEGLEVVQYDTKTLGAGQGYIVEYAMELLEQNLSVAEILPKLDQMRFKDSIAMYTINTLKYLKRGGRIGKVEGTIGELLHIKPVVTVNDEGVYITLSKAIGMQRSILTMKDILVKKFAGQTIDLTVHFGDDEEKASQLGSMLQKALSVRTLTISPLTPVLGIHTGPQMFAFVARKV